MYKTVFLRNIKLWSLLFDILVFELSLFRKHQQLAGDMHITNKV